jgi:hypothetical protein
MARNPHVSIGCHEFVLLHHRGREIDKSCNKPFKMRAWPLSRSINEPVLFQVLFRSVFLLLYEQSDVFMDAYCFLMTCRRYVQHHL